MKSEYKIYGTQSKELEATILPHEHGILADYIAYCGTTAGKTKVNDYRRYLLQFRDVVEKALDQITKSDAVAFWALVNHSPHEEATKITIRRTVKRFLAWHYKDPALTADLRNKSFRVNERKINQSALLMPEELEAILRAAERIRDKALLVLLYESAARPQEIRDLRWEHIDWERQEIQLYSRKKKRARRIPVRQAILHLRRWEQEYCYPNRSIRDFVFPRQRGTAAGRSHPISIGFIDRIVMRAAKKAGIQRRIYPYLFRHSRLTEIHKLGVKGADHNIFAGHEIGSKQQGTYVHLNDEDMKKTVLECVYNVKEVTQKESQSAKEIAELRRELEEMRSFMESWRVVAKRLVMPSQGVTKAVQGI